MNSAKEKKINKNYEKSFQQIDTSFMNQFKSDSLTNSVQIKQFKIISINFVEHFQNNIRNVKRKYL